MCNNRKKNVCLKFNFRLRKRLRCYEKKTFFFVFIARDSSVASLLRNDGVRFEEKAETTAALWAPPLFPPPTPQNRCHSEWNVVE